MTNPQVSVVIPAFNEEKYLGNTLKSLKKDHQKTKYNYEVIVVDNNSTDRTFEIANQFKNKMNLKIIKETKQGRGAARARGFKEAKGEIILSADADAIYYPNWIEILASGIKGDVIAVSTSAKIVDGPTITNLLFNFFQPTLMLLYRILLGHFWLSGFSFSIKKSVYLKSGGFDQSLQGQEDTELSFRVAKLGKVKFVNIPVVFSSRRFKNGIILGTLDYINSYHHAFIKKSSGYLNNPR